MQEMSVLLKSGTCTNFSGNPAIVAVPLQEALLLPVLAVDMVHFDGRRPLSQPRKPVAESVQPVSSKTS